MLVESLFLQALSLAKLALQVESSSPQVSGAFPLGSENLEVITLYDFLYYVLKSEVNSQVPTLGNFTLFFFLFFECEFLNCPDSAQGTKMGVGNICFCIRNLFFDIQLFKTSLLSDFS